MNVVAMREQKSAQQIERERVAKEAGRMACRLGEPSCSYPTFEGDHAALRNAWLKGWGDEFKERT